jgi:hypothetical protein
MEEGFDDFLSFFDDPLQMGIVLLAALLSTYLLYYFDSKGQHYKREEPPSGP